MASIMFLIKLIQHTVSFLSPVTPLELSRPNIIRLAEHFLLEPVISYPSRVDVSVAAMNVSFHTIRNVSHNKKALKTIFRGIIWIHTDCRNIFTAHLSSRPRVMLPTYCHNIPFHFTLESRSEALSECEVLSRSGNEKTFSVKSLW